MGNAGGGSNGVELADEEPRETLKPFACILRLLARRSEP